MKIQLSPAARASIFAAAKVSKGGNFPIMFSTRGVIYGNRMFMGFLPWDVLSPGTEYTDISYPLVFSPEDFLNAKKESKVRGSAPSVFDTMSLYFDYTECSLVAEKDMQNLFSCPLDIKGAVEYLLAPYNPESLREAKGFDMGAISEGLNPWKEFVGKKEALLTRVLESYEDQRTFVVVRDIWGRWHGVGVTRNMTVDEPYPQEFKWIKK